MGQSGWFVVWHFDPEQLLDAQNTQRLPICCTIRNSMAGDKTVVSFRRIAFQRTGDLQIGLPELE